jgi:very-short-patch-repair endonuclease
MRNRSSTLQLHAAQLRSWLTPSEAALWQLIRGGRTGVWFRRQVVIGRYIVDFAAPSARLIIEIDGAYHSLRRSADARRDRHLSRRGYRILRLDAELVLEQAEQALALVRRALLMPRK